MKTRYNFDRFRKGELMAEGVAVHANSMAEALVKANALLNGEDAELRFTDNEPCVAALKCQICESPPEGGES